MYVVIDTYFMDAFNVIYGVQSHIPVPKLGLSFTDYATILAKTISDTH